MKKIIALLSPFLITVFACAQTVNTHPAYVSLMRTTAPLYGQPQTLTICGGVVVDEKRKLIATALHCIPNDKNMLKMLSVNGGPVELMDFRLEADIAILQITDLRGVKAPMFATPKIGEFISAYAFFDGFNVAPLGPQNPGDHLFMPVSIREVLSWESKVITVAYGEKREPPFFDKPVKTAFKWIVAANNPTHGFSGGPVFDKKGNFVGIISNGNGGFTNVSSSENVQLLLKQIK